MTYIIINRVTHKKVKRTCLTQIKPRDSYANFQPYIIALKYGQVQQFKQNVVTTMMEAN